MGGGPKDEAAWLRKFVEHYDNLGKIKWAKTRRKKEGQNEQLKYELIFWNNFDLRIKKAHAPYSFNWERITRLIG